MTPDVPGPYELVLLAVASYRLWRLVAEDDIMERPRRWLLRLGDWQPPEPAPAGYREKLADLLTCPWCLGFWIALAWWAAWVWLEEWAVFPAVPFVLSAGVGFCNAIVGALTED